MNDANLTKCNTFVNLCHVESYGLTTRHSGLTPLIAPGGPINVGGSGCFVAGTKVRIDALPLSRDLELSLTTVAAHQRPTT